MSQLQKNLDYVSSIKNYGIRSGKIMMICKELLIRHARLAELEASSFVIWYFSGHYICRGIPKEVVELLVEEAKKKIEKSKVPIMDILEQYKDRYADYLQDEMETSLWSLVEERKKENKQKRKSQLM